MVYDLKEYMAEEFKKLNTLCFLISADVIPTPAAVFRPDGTGRQRSVLFCLWFLLKFTIIYRS